MNPIHSAMATAIDRHNTAETSVIKRLAEQQQTIDELRRQLKAVRAENADLRLKADSPLPMFGEGSGVRLQGGEVKAGSGTKALEYFNNRPVLTLKQVADQLNVKYHSAARYARAGAWELTKVNGTVYIYADQPITKPAPKRRAKKAA